MSTVAEPIALENHKVVSRDEWVKARKDFLKKEKEATHLRDILSAERRKLPWVKVEKNYVFEGPKGKVTLADLFQGRSQLVIKHFMLAPGQEQPCVGCSFEADHIGPALVHLEHHDVTYAVVARATIAEIEAYRKRMGWQFTWVSSFNNSFNYDFNASFTKEQIENGTAFYNYEMTALPMEDLSGHSVFYKNEKGEIFHTYSAFGRGAEEVLTSYMYLDMTPKGRNETGPNFNLTDWVRPHDKYDEGGTVSPIGRYQPPKTVAGCCSGPGGSK